MARRWRRLGDDRGSALLVAVVAVEDMIISGHGKLEDMFTYNPGMGDIPWPIATPVDRKVLDYQ